MAVKRKTRLEAESVSAAESARNNACCKKRVPHIVYDLMRSIYLESVLTGISCAADDHVICPVIGIESKFCSRSQSEGLHRIFLSLRPLQGYLSPYIRLIVNLDIIAFCLCAEPFVILCNVGCIDNKKIMIRNEFLIDKEVIDCCSVRVQHHAIEDLAVFHACDVV